MYKQLLITIGFALSFLLVTVMLAALWQSANFPQEVEIGQAGPAVASVLILFAFGYRKRFKPFLIERNHPLYVYVMAASIPFVLALGAGRLVPMVLDSEPMSLLPVDGRIWLFLLWVLIGTILEELGWRNFLQRHVNQIEGTTWRPLYGFILVGVLWSAWHIQSYTFGLVFVFGQCLLLTSTSIVLGDITQRFGQNIITAALAHMSINLGVIYLVFNDMFSVITTLVYGLLSALFALYYWTSIKKQLKN